MNPTTEKYTPGHTPNATSFMAARDLESHGFFLTPLLQRGFHVLDAGCGPGTITTGIAEAVFPGTVTAIDIAPGQLEYARRLAQGREIMNLHFADASACALPFADETFDLVFAHALLEHLRDPRKAMREFHRVTRPGGFVAVCSPDWDAFDLFPFSDRVREAVQTYRDLQERNGGNTRAGAMLGRWISEAGFTPLATDAWTEEYEDAGRIGEYLALQLGTAGHTRQAEAIRQWARDSGAQFRQVWNYAIAVRADRNRLQRLVTE